MEHDLKRRGMKAGTGKGSKSSKGSRSYKGMSYQDLKAERAKAEEMKRQMGITG